MPNVNAHRMSTISGMDMRRPRLPVTSGASMGEKSLSMT